MASDARLIPLAVQTHCVMPLRTEQASAPLEVSDMEENCLIQGDPSCPIGPKHHS
ncbi:hypothetical protein COLO4_28956 [Corchorus olitorius]|uniref:Uncharacterized protein n=1 Tax=Corchorus olitorius TaxID=93759 RepID=A0A1R3HHC8_9ROSI|nr:hypothetical protein COLO4_28956 [Corchorus olitorius]